MVGAQRAGSTHLGARLRDHPDLFLCPDEVPFFEDPFYLTTPPSALAPVFARARPGQRLGIQRPDYLAKPECAARIRSFAPAAKILAVLRDPVARAVSAYFWYVQFGLLPLAPLDEGMERLLEGWTDSAHPHAQEVLEYGFYGRHLRTYLEVFGRELVLVLLNEELDSPAALAGLYRFLGADERHRPGPLPRRTNAGVYDLRRLRLLRARRRLVWHWDDTDRYHYAPRRSRRPVRLLPNAAIVGFDRLVLAAVLGNSRPALDGTLAAALEELYADDVGLLESLLGRDLSAWRKRRDRPRED